MITLGTDEITKYPFLTEGGQFLKDKGFSLDQFCSDPDLKIIVNNAYQRIETAANGQIHKSDLQNSSSNESSLSLEVFSFLIAVILLKLSRDFLLPKQEGLKSFWKKILRIMMNIMKN